MHGILIDDDSGEWCSDNRAAVASVFGRVITGEDGVEQGREADGRPWLNKAMVHITYEICVFEM